MNIVTQPDAFQKLAQMGDVTLYEPAGDRPQAEVTGRRRRNKPGLADCITQVATPQGRKPVLKTLLTSACERDCYYCPFRAGRGETRRVSLKPVELAEAFERMRRTGLVDGLFLSSGIVNGGVTTQDKVLEAVELVRERYGYRGYVHLKIMPGAEYAQVERAVQLADRVSVNLEGPTPERLRALAPHKVFTEELLERLRWASEIRARLGRRVSLVTQFVVGAVGDTDVELLTLSKRLYRELGLSRAYYSRFSPVRGTPFEGLAATSPLREHRLYQASFLLRDYGWTVEELPFGADGNLRLETDPKRAWAEAHLREAPVEVMRASREELLRVPGIGPRGADAIVRARRRGRLTDLAHLRAIGIRAPEWAAPYILLDGRAAPRQLPLL